MGIEVVAKNNLQTPKTMFLTQIILKKNDLRASDPLCGLIFPMSLCHLYALMFYLYVLVCHSYISHMCSYVIRKLLVCTRMLSVCHPYVFLCHPYVTHMYSYVICMSLICGFTIKVLGETLCLHEEKLIICSTQSYQCLFPGVSDTNFVSPMIPIKWPWVCVYNF